MLLNWCYACNSTLERTYYSGFFEVSYGVINFKFCFDFKFSTDIFLSGLSDRIKG